MNQVLLSIGLLGLIMTAAAASADEATMMKLPVTKDVWVSAYPEELDTSMGKTTQLKLKGNTEVALLGFDTSAVDVGQRVVRAELWMHDVLEAAEVDKKRLGVDPTRPDCLRKIGLSTIATPWEEGSQTESYKPDPVGATYRNAAPDRPWAYPGSQLWAAIFGNGGSLHCHGERQYQGNGWWKVEVDPRLVNQVIDGLSHGLVIEEESSPANEFMPNNYVHSRESGEFAPYLLVALAPGAASPPPPAAPPSEPEPLQPTVALPATTFHPTAGDPPANDRLQVWAFPEVTKVDPVTGEAMFEPQSDLRRANAVWDGAHRSVRIAAARGEIAAFQLAIEAKGKALRNVRVGVSDLRRDRGVIPASVIRTYRMWYVPAGGKWQEEYAIPLRGAFDLPAADNAVPGQKVQAVYVDVVVPLDAPEGTYRGTALVTADGAAPLALNVEVQVYPVTIPAEISFNAELNAYEPPGGEAGSDYFYAAHRLAHYNRCTVNALGYSQTGNIAKGYAPALAGEGKDVHTADWSEFDRIMSPLLDGSAFKDNPRPGVPVKTFYLPLSEHWPLRFMQYYPFQGDPKQEPDMARHALEAPPIEEAFPPEYKAGWGRVAREFGEHLAAKGWNRTDFQCYLNDKPFYGGTWWTLDEPMGRDDWLALRFWSGLFKEATSGLNLPNLRFRCDISRPWWQYDMLDGRMDTIYYNSEIFSYPAFAKDFNRRLPDPHVYGAANDVAESDHQTAAWCLKAFTLGLNGVLPWQSLGGPDSLRKPDQTALIVPGDLAGYRGPVASLRLLALRRGAQDVELLRLLARKHQWTNEQVGALVASRVPLGSVFTQRFQDEAAAPRFGELSAQGFAEMKEGVLELLTR